MINADSFSLLPNTFFLFFNFKVELWCYFRFMRNVADEWPGVSEERTVSIFRVTKPVKFEVSPTRRTSSSEDHQLTNNLRGKWKFVEVPFAVYCIHFLNPPFLLI
jgi:hypothetical protein